MADSFTLVSARYTPPTGEGDKAVAPLVNWSNVDGHAKTDKTTSFSVAIGDAPWRHEETRKQSASLAHRLACDDWERTSIQLSLIERMFRSLSRVLDGTA